MVHAKSLWNVENVANMEALFDQSAFNRPLDKWRVASVTNMYGMFYGAASFKQNLGWCVGDHAPASAATGP